MDLSRIHVDLEKAINTYSEPRIVSASRFHSGRNGIIVESIEFEVLFGSIIKDGYTLNKSVKIRINDSEGCRSATCENDVYTLKKSD